MAVAPIAAAQDEGAADSAPVVELNLKGTVSVTVKGEHKLKVVLDGEEVGPAPYEGELSVGTHTVRGTSATHTAAEQTIEIAEGKIATVELVAKPRDAKFEIRIAGEKGTIIVDGVEKGTGAFAGELSPGEHTVRVVRNGFDPFVKTFDLEPGQAYAETVTLHRSVDDKAVEDDAEVYSFDGLYGGLSLGAIFSPTGSGNSPETSCDALGATSCDGGLPTGANLAGYIGYAIRPMGIELYLNALADLTQPSATFDGVTGSEINPLVASPAREESFQVLRIGGGGAVRARLLIPIDFFHFSAAAGVGLSYRHLLVKREVAAEDGGANEYADDVGYLSPALSGELAGQFHVSRSTSLAVGLQVWLETAGDTTVTEPDPDAVLIGGPLPQPVATPSYDVAAGAQFFLGPYLGLQFGP